MPHKHKGRKTSISILLMGPTGSGKPEFVNLLTKGDQASSAHDLQYHLNTSHYVDAQSGVSVTLLDTPGFDDTRSHISDTELLERIAGFLQEGDEHKVNGILYFHRISESRTGGPVEKNLKIFKQLCGENNFSHVHVVTTHWNMVDEKDGLTRETALKNGTFKALFEGGAKFFRHDQSSESAKSIIHEFRNSKAFKLRIQEELEGGKPLGQTSAGRVLLEDMRAMEEKYEKEAEVVRQEMVDAVVRGDDDKLVTEEREMREEVLERIREEMKKLERTVVGKRHGAEKAGDTKEKMETPAPRQPAAKS